MVILNTKNLKSLPKESSTELFSNLCDGKMVLFLPQILIDKFIYHYRVQEEGKSRKKNQIGFFQTG